MALYQHKGVSWKVQIKFLENAQKAFQIQSKTMPVGEIIYSERYEDEEFEYRHVKLLNTKRFSTTR